MKLKSVSCPGNFALVISPAGSIKARRITEESRKEQIKNMMKRTRKGTQVFIVSPKDCYTKV